MDRYFKYLFIVMASGILGFYQNCSPVGFSQQSSSPCSGADCLNKADNVPVSVTQDVTFNAPVSKVDILFIDDDSGSMSTEQSNLGSRLNTFVSQLGNLDW